MTNIKRIPSNPLKFSEYITEKQADILIFGADIAGKILLKILNSKGFVVKGFLDNNKNKCEFQIDSIPVYHAPNFLINESKESIIFIASTYISDIIVQLEDFGFYHWCPIVEFINENPLHTYKNILKGEMRRNHAGGEFTEDFDILVLENMMRSQIKYLDENVLFIRSVDLILTEKCSLKCVDCSNLMQYYDKPVDIVFQEICEDLDNLCEIADEINEIRIIGGDPLMNKDFHKAISYAANKKNVNKVVVYTNGTICPPREKILEIAHPKVFIFITTYGELSKKTAQLTSLLTEFRIPFNSQPAYGWTDCADINYQNRSVENMNTTFRNCCAKHFTTITNGRIFRCPYSANVERLAAIPHTPSDYFEIKNFSKLEDHMKIEKRNKLRHFLRNISYIEACNYCNGRTYGDPEITPGVQTKKILHYVKFERIQENDI
jgi:hypothetical protein